MENVWAKVQAKQDNKSAKLELLENKEVSEDSVGNVVVEGDNQAKFLGFLPVNKHYKYILTNDGSVARVHGTFDFMFSIPAEVQ